MISPKLKKGDEVRIIAPARSMTLLSNETREIATERFASLGLKVTFGKHVEDEVVFSSASVKSRLQDLHDAFRDPKVKGIFTVIGGFNSNPVIGGFNSNQLLSGIDYELIRKNPKVFCGYSDITALGNAFYAKAGLVTYYGPHFSTFGMRHGIEYTLDYLRKAVMENASINVEPSKQWRDDPWYRDQEACNFITNSGHQVIRPGKAEGTVVGGNMCTLQLLFGTAYMPPLKDTIVFLEDDDEQPSTTAQNFDRDLQQLIQLPGFSGVRGIVIGRFCKASNLDDKIIKSIVTSKPELSSIPVMYGADFGHTTPCFTFPIGGKARIDTAKKSIEILEH
ncbi:MAG: S66 peptidase family protein [Candidatus Woesearchaeota archaeon]